MLFRSVGIDTSYASNYTKRNPKSIGDNVGIILDSNNNPITGSGGRFDTLIGSHLMSQVYTIYYNSIIAQTSGSGRLYASSRYSGCDTNDIVVSGNGKAYTFAACNV